jgi:phage-related protein
MRVLTLDKAEKELRDFPLEIQKQFLNYFKDFENGEILSLKEFKKLSGSDLYEFRVKGKSGIYRAIAGRVKPDLIVVVFFHKKTQKTPKEILKTAGNRLRNIIV